jgi:hypothetical protein
MPMPAVEMKTPSALPRSTTLVSPVMTGTPVDRAAAPMLSAMRFKSASAKPSRNSALIRGHSVAGTRTRCQDSSPCQAS